MESREDFNGRSLYEGGYNIPAMPHKPKPELRTVEPLFTSATAASALSYSFDFGRICDCDRRIDVVERNRRLAGPALAAWRSWAETVLREHLAEALGKASLGCIGRISVAIVQRAKNTQ